MQTSENLKFLRSTLEAQVGGWQHNYFSYYGSRGSSVVDAWTRLPLGLQMKGQDTRFDTTKMPCFLLVKSVIDTVTSKIAQVKVRPFFSTFDGDYKSTRAARALQRYFDAYFDEQQLYSLMPEVFRSAAIFNSSMGDIKMSEVEETITETNSTLLEATLGIGFCAGIIKGTEDKCDFAPDYREEERKCEIRSKAAGAILRKFVDRYKEEV